MTSRFAFFAIGCALLLSGCNPTTVGIAASPLFVEGKQTNLLNQSYAAVDSITVQTKQKFPERSTLRIAQLEEIVDTSKKRVIRNPELGIMMTDQIRSRFEQLGYPVVEGDAKGQLTGLYQVIGKQLAVRLKLSDARTGVLMRQYDYWMPITSDMRRYMDPYGGGIPLYKVREGLDSAVDR
jgi:hypothetical protein